MERMFMYMAVDVKAAQKRVEEEQLSGAVEVENQVVDLLKAGDSVSAKEQLTTFQNSNSAKYAQTWVNLWETLLCKYHDGYRLMNYHTETFVSDTLFYPFEWLSAVGFFVQKPDLSATSWTYTVDPPLSTHPKPYPSSHSVTVAETHETHETHGAVDSSRVSKGKRSISSSKTGVVLYPAPSIQYAEMNGETTGPGVTEEVSAFTLMMTVVLCGLVVSPIAVVAGKRLAHSQMQHSYQPIGSGSQ
jgi:hypothetical protein